jgi:hypothetical protein
VSREPGDHAVFVQVADQDKRFAAVWGHNCDSAIIYLFNFNRFLPIASITHSERLL